LTGLEGLITLGGDLLITDKIILPTSLADDLLARLISHGYTGNYTIGGNL
jgi:hypothetical protein